MGRRELKRLRRGKEETDSAEEIHMEGTGEDYAEEQEGTGEDYPEDQEGIAEDYPEEEKPREPLHCDGQKQGDGVFREAQVKRLEKEKAVLEEQVAFLQTWNNLPATDGQGSVTGKKTDVVIVSLEGEAMEAHKAVLQARSTVLEGGSISTALEKNLANPLLRIYMGISSQGVQAFVKFLYTGSLAKVDLEYHSLELLWASEKYHVEYLGRLCRAYNDQVQLNIANLIHAFEVTSRNVEWENHKESLLLVVVRDHMGFFEAPAYVELKSRCLYVATQLCEEVCRINAAGNALAIVSPSASSGFQT